MADRQRLTLARQDHLLVGDEPGKPHGVDRRRRRRTRSAVAFAVPGERPASPRGAARRSRRGASAAASAAKRIISTAPSAKFGA